MGRDMHTDGDRDDGTCVLSLEGDFDQMTVPAVRERMRSAVEAGCTNVVLDLSRVEYMDSSALGFIVWADKQLGPVSGRLALAGANRDVARILELSGLIGVAPCVIVCPSTTQALASTHLPVGPEPPLWAESFEFTSDARHMAAARTRVAEIVSPLGMTASEVFDIKVAVGEALANAVRHGSPRGSGDVVAVEVRAYNDRVDVVVSDSGAGFDGALECRADTLAPSGRGVLFMRALMDSVEFRPSAGGGTDVLLGKRRPVTV